MLDRTLDRVLERVLVMVPDIVLDKVLDRVLDRNRMYSMEWEELGDSLLLVMAFGRVG